MKKYICFLLSGMSLFGCSGGSEDEPEKVQSYTPLYAQVAIDVVDSDYNNLFSYLYKGTIDREGLENSLTYTYKGVTYPVYIFEPKSPQGNPYLPHSCIYIDCHLAGNNGIPQIFFGTFDGTKDLCESVIINWPDGTSNKIEFTSEARTGPSTIQTRVDDGPWYKSSYVTLVK